MYVFLTMRENSNEACDEIWNAISERRESKKDIRTYLDLGNKLIECFCCRGGSLEKAGKCGVVSEVGVVKIMSHVCKPLSSCPLRLCTLK
jgi:hypothetical protein